MTREEAIHTLNELGLTPVETTAALARKLGIYPMGIELAAKEHRLEAVGAHAFSIEAVADWLAMEPQYLYNALERRERKSD